jgi:hypothetical protein
MTRLPLQCAISIAMLGSAGCAQHAASTPGQAVPDVHVLDSVVAASGERVWPAPERSISAPTVIAFYALTREQVERGGDGTAAFTNFGQSVRDMTQTFDSAGVRLYFQYSDTIKYRLDGVPHAWNPPSGSPRVGYLFLAPRRPFDARYGVMSKTALWDQVRDWIK